MTAPSRLGQRAAVALVVIASFILADLGMAQLGKVFVPGWEVRSHRLKFRVSDPVFHHGLAPSVTQVDRWGNIGYPLFTNSLGLRDAQVRELSPQPTGKRIAFIGDSFTEGVGFPWEKTFVGQVAKALEPQGIEVINLGVSSYSPVLYYKKVKFLTETKGLRFDELIVFVDTGDIYNEARWYELTSDDSVISHVTDGANIAKRRGRFGDWLAVNSLMGKMGYTLADLWRYHQSQKLISDEQRSAGEDADTATSVNAKDASWTYDDHAWEEWGKLGLERALANMDRLQAITRQLGVRLTIAVYPWPGQIWRHQVENRETEAFREWARQRGAGFITLYPDLVKPDAAKQLEQFYIVRDIHWNENGHTLVADKVLDYLKNRDGGS